MFHDRFKDFRDEIRELLVAKPVSMLLKIVGLKFLRPRGTPTMNKLIRQNFACTTSFKMLISQLFRGDLNKILTETLRNNGSLGGL